MRQGANDYDSALVEAPLHYDNEVANYANIQMGVSQMMHQPKPDMNKVESFATFGKQGSYTSLQNMNASQYY